MSRLGKTLFLRIAILAYSRYFGNMLTISDVQDMDMNAQLTIINMFRFLSRIIDTYFSSRTAMFRARLVDRRQKRTVDETRDLIRFYFEPTDGQDDWTCMNESCNLNKHSSSWVKD